MMNPIVRRSAVRRTFDDAGPLFAAFVNRRVVSLFGATSVPALHQTLGATVRATLAGDGTRCSICWDKIEGALALPLHFEGTLWVEPDPQDPQCSWVAVDGDYIAPVSDPVSAIIGRRLTGSLARDLLSRIGDYMEMQHRGGDPATG